MKNLNRLSCFFSSTRKFILFIVQIFALGLSVSTSAKAQVDLADNPLFSTAVTGNVALALSVEWPTAVTSSYRYVNPDNTITLYNINNEYIGYFDHNKCYRYFNSSSNGAYFVPVGMASSHSCANVTNGRWSGNMLNWALTQTIDPFRYALSGGYRAIDQVGLTVLEKAYAIDNDLAQNHTINDPDIIRKSTPFENLTSFTTGIRGLGTKFNFTGTGNVNSSTTTAYTSDTNMPSATTVYQLNARVQVCKSDLLESNCTQYPNGDYKPTGLIQKNALKLNFAAFGYLNDSNSRRDGGVLRARMGPLGPYSSVSGSSYSPNANAEWDANTGIFISNPATADANATNSTFGLTGSNQVNKSGVINYLNQFGLSSRSYKSFDPVSELYYATGRYFRNKGNVREYTNNATVGHIDGFPVITEWDDPVKYSCQQNFIIGIGDGNTHFDANLPGSQLSSFAEDRTRHSQVHDEDFGSLINTSINYQDVKTSTNKIGNLEGLGNLGERYLPWCCSGPSSTFFIAGLAYDLNTRDFRPDLLGKQTISTYWLDVLERGDRKDFGRTGMRNQYWLATKYGGFKVPADFSPYDSNAATPDKSLWDTNNDDDPDNYFRANNPALMIEGLSKAFDSIVSKLSGSKSAFAIAAKNVTENDYVFSSKYNATNWSGNIMASKISFDNAGEYTLSEIWQGVNTLESQAAGNGWSSRNIATSNCGNKDATTGMQNCQAKGIAFRHDKLSTTMQTNLTKVGASTVKSQELLNFLRGDRSNAGENGSKSFRDREKILGDIVNSQVRAVGKPNAPYSETFNPGYTDFKNANKSRPTVAYVGANDGMLHAFEAATGKELFAYVPHALFNGPNNTPEEDGLAALGKTSYVHHAYVDSTPVVFDVNFGGGDADWHSLLIGGLGKGGKSYYAIDVTNPASLSSESALASAVKWEFTHKDLGYSYGKPLVVKAGGKWLVILTSGYNNQDGNGYFFILDAATGELLNKIGPVGGNIGSASNQVGMAHVTAFVKDRRDFTADAAYAGDLMGNVWRLDLTNAASNSYPSPTQFAKLISPSGGNQPITVSPVVEVDKSTSKRYVFVGTGRLLADSDISSTQQQTFYAIVDGTASAFYTDATLPSAAGGFPIKRASMVDNTTGTTGISTSAASAKPMGYYMDLGFGDNGVAYRINTDIASSAGIVAFSSNLTSNSVCSAEAKYRGYAITYGLGKTVLNSDDLETGKNYVSGSGLITAVSVYKKPDSNTVSVNFSKDDGTNKSYDTTASTQSYQQLNWRVLPTND
jgi:type IV pilus assembly protein PilY1